MIISEQPDIMQEINEIWQKGTIIDFNSLPEFSPWSARMLGLTDWTRVERSPGELEREFETETYIPQYQAAVQNTNITDANELLQKIYGLSDMCCVRSNEFRKLCSKDAHKVDALFTLSYLQRFCRNIEITGIVDVGAGNGRIIIPIALSEVGKSFSVNFYALERMATGRKIIELLAKRSNCDIIVGDCDISNDISEWDIPPNSLIYTNYVLTALTSHPKDIIEQICTLKPAMVMNFEPFVTFHSQNTLYGQLCRRYIDINKYNTTFDNELRKHNGKTIEIIHEEGNIFGINPYLPKSVMIWKPK
jgi:hypothetical protein